MTTPINTPTHSETVNRIAAALADRADFQVRAANSRPLSGPQYKAQRAAHREEAKRCNALRAALIADVGALDRLVNQ
jgi:translation initiation factor 2B subunit (eIF-2B alpha/beta/delta family)